MSINKQQTVENIAQHEMFETAQRRIRQKRRLFQHLIFFVLGSLFMFIVNKVLDYGKEYNWYLWGILAWGFFFLVHLINVFITDRFLGKNWQRKQREYLVSLQEKKIMKMQAKIEKEYAKMAQKAEKEDTTEVKTESIPPIENTAIKPSNTNISEDPKV